MPDGFAKLRARGLAVSVAVHLGLVVMVFLEPGTGVTPPEPARLYGAYVVFRWLPKPPGASGPAPQAMLKTTRRRFLRQPRETPLPPPIDPAPEEIAPEPESQVELFESYYPELDGNEVAGPAGIGMAPSGSGTAVGGGGPPGGGPRNFDEQAMIAPHRLSGSDPSYTRAALERDIEGVMLVGCHVAVDGKVKACRVLRSLPFMERAAISALENCTYSPARLADGTPVEVEYVFRIVMRLKDA